MATILIVEDNEEIRKNLVEYLESKGYKTDNTEDGLQALGLVTLNQYDLTKIPEIPQSLACGWIGEN